jgi:spore cortex biosynthesis protein YabQ
MYNFSQEQIFIFFFIIGIIIGIFFDIFRVIRKSFKTTDIITFFEDLVFLLASSVLIIFSILKINGGEVRFYLFLGIFFRNFNIFFDNK